MVSEILMNYLYIDVNVIRYKHRKLLMSFGAPALIGLDAHQSRGESIPYDIAVFQFGDS